MFQETWIRVLERGHQYDGRHEFGTWLFVVARNVAISHLRRKQAASLDEMVDTSDLRSPSAFDLTIQRERQQRVSAGMQ